MYDIVNRVYLYNKQQSMYWYISCSFFLVLILNRITLNWKMVKTNLKLVNACMSLSFLLKDGIIE